MGRYRCLIREYCTYEVYVDADNEDAAEEEATAMYKSGSIYKDLYDYDLAVDAMEVDG